MEFTLSAEEKITLLKTARLSIQSKLFNKDPDYPEPTKTLSLNCGAFVSLHINGKLRGCIGYIQAVKPLMETIKEMARSAAFNDPRFTPLTQSEFGDVDIEISVLSPMKKIDDLNEIKVGVHGIIVRRGMYSGLLLPQVAVQYGWDREEFLSHTCQKAGLPSNCWKLNDIEIEIFNAIVFNEQKSDLEKKS